MFEYLNVPMQELPLGTQMAVEEFRLLPLEYRREVPLWIYILPKGTPMGKMTKREANYISVSKYRENCGNCKHWYMHGKTGTHICDLMKGKIALEAWCRLWKG